MKHLFSRILLLVSLSFLATPVAAVPLVVDLSDSLIRVDVGFAGDEVLMFGSVDAPVTDAPIDLIVTVTGPRENYKIRKKSRVLGIWINGGTYKLNQMPNFYSVASTRPLTEILDEETLESIEAGTDRIKVNLDTRFISSNYARDRKGAFIRNMKRSGLYKETVEPVVFLGNQLFRTKLDFPSNVGTGAYQVQAHLVQEGEIVFSTGVPLAVRKVGREAQIYAFAHNQSLLYGIICVLLAIIWGYASYRVFRKL